MILSNRFNDEDKARVWVYNPYCANCGSNYGVAGHHIYGCKMPNTNSIVNCILLCNDCHREADGQNTHQTGNPLRQKYLAIALRQVVKSGHQFTETDKKFLESIQDDVDVVLHK
jgi:hypothetical protein